MPVLPLAKPTVPKTALVLARPAVVVAESGTQPAAIDDHDVKVSAWAISAVDRTAASASGASRMPLVMWIPLVVRAAWSGRRALCRAGRAVAITGRYPGAGETRGDASRSRHAVAPAAALCRRAPAACHRGARRGGASVARE